MTATIEQFLEALFEPDDLIELRPLAHDGTTPTVRGWYTRAKLAGMNGELEKLNERNSIYIGINPRNRHGGTRSDVAICRCVFADFDNETLETVWRRIDASGLPHPTIIVNSGGGVHCYWRLVEAIDVDTFEQTQRGIAGLLGSDGKVCDAPRIMRLPGTINRKPERHGARCELIELNDDRHEIETIVLRLPEPEPARPTPTPAPVTIHKIDTAGNSERAWKYLQKMDDAIAGKGGHDATFAAACECFRFGLSDADALAVMTRFNAEKCRPPWSDNELQHKLADAHKRVMTAGEFGSRLEPAPTRSTRNAETNQANDAPILDPHDPRPAARELVRAEFTYADRRTLHHHRGDFLKWTGTHYHPLADAELRAVAYQFTERAMTLVKPKKEEPFLAPFQPTQSKINNIIDALTALVVLPGVTDPPAWLDPQPGDPDPAECVAMSNGLLHLPTGKLHPLTPRLLNRNALTFAHEPDAGEPTTWLQFLSQLWPDDPDAIRTLQQWMGYCLTTDTRQQKILLIVGPKRSGKGTIARVMTSLIGAANVAGPTLAGLAGQFGLESLIGKPLAIIADARLSGRADQAAIAERLLSISGEDTTTVNRKHRNDWIGKLPTRFMILTNELPRLADASGALASRFIVLTLQETFIGREDHGLTNRLLTELPAILNWSIQGWRDLQQAGRFTTPSSSIEAVQELEDLGSPISAFIRDRCTIEAGRSVEAGRLFKAWGSWCVEQGRDKPGTAQTFGRDLRAAVAGLRTSRPRVDDLRVRFYEGIDLNE